MPLYAKKQQTTHESYHAQFGEVIPGAIDKYPYAAPSADEEALPPPVVVLATELDVDRYDRDFCDSDNENEGNDG